jgi:hypothetical protein
MDSLAAIRRPVGIGLVPAGLVLKILFEISYVYHIAPFWDYSGLVLSLNYQKLVESYVIVLLLLLLVSWCERAPSVIVLIVGLFNGIIPLASIYALQDRPVIFLLFTVLSYLLSLAMTTLPRVRLAYMGIAPENFLAICFVSLAAVIGLMISQRAYRHFTLDLYAVYDFRHELSELVFVGPFRYLADWAHSVFNIALLLWGLYYRKKLLVAAACALQLFMFGCILLKAILFNFPFVILTYFVLRRRANIVVLCWLMCAVVLLGMLEIWILDQDNLTVVVTRRVLAIPAYLAYEYYDLFNKIGHVYWTDGLLGSWASYPFADDPPRLVAQFAFDAHNTWANNGMYGTGFMQAGFAGMVLYGVVYGLWLYFIDCIAIGRVPVEIAVGMVIVPATLVMTDADLLTSFLTHGGIAATLMLWLWAGIMTEEARVRQQELSLPAHASGSN